MTIVIALAIFFDVLLVGVFLVLLFSSENSTLVDRLTQLGGGGAGAQAVVREKREPSRKKVERVLTDVSKLLPPSAREVTQFHRLMIRAGYRETQNNTPRLCAPP